jgi:hypothetical protein
MSPFAFSIETAWALCVPRGPFPGDGPVLSLSSSMPQRNRTHGIIHRWLPATGTGNESTTTTSRTGDREVTGLIPSKRLIYGGLALCVQSGDNVISHILGGQGCRVLFSLASVANCVILLMVIAPFPIPVPRSVPVSWIYSLKQVSATLELCSPNSVYWSQDFARELRWARECYRQHKNRPPLADCRPFPSKEACRAAISWRHQAYPECRMKHRPHDVKYLGLQMNATKHPRRFLDGVRWI